MNLNEWAREIHENAVNHGWWEQERELPEVLMLIVSELSEALEEARAGRPMVWRSVPGNIPFDENVLYANMKPEGIAVEVIDALIRILDWCGKEGLDVEALVAEKHEYNKTRPYKHGKKF